MTNEEIKTWCKNSKISQAELADLIGYSSSTLRQTLNGFAKMQPRMLDAILRIIEEHEKPKSGFSVPLSPEKRKALQLKAQDLGQSVEDLFLQALSEVLGEDVRSMRHDVSFAEKKSNEYQAHEEEPLEAAEEE